MNRIEVTVNQLTWTEKATRVDKPCKSCQRATKGRIGFVPYCMDCGMAELMKPVASAVGILRGLFK